MTAYTLLLAAALAQAPDKVDVSAYKSSLRVVTDGARHYLVYDKTKAYSGPAFYGDGKTFAQLRIKGGGASGEESFDVSFWEPRVVPGVSGYASFSMKDSGKTYEVSCGKKVTPVKPVEAEEARKLIDAASFTTHSFLRLPEKLLRDDKGNYYFVDRLRTEEFSDRRDFRLFIGPRGKMKVQPLKDIVDDSEGMIFSTKDGQLRLVTAKGDVDGKKQILLKWVAGKAELPLIDVPLDDQRNVKMIYTELGPYDGMRLGTPCDDMF